LINNAIDAMENQGGTLSISGKQENASIVIKVTDTGKGIPEANLDRIFDPFFTTKPVGKGTGLGLSICYGIIEKMGGKIEVLKILKIMDPRLAEIMITGHGSAEAAEQGLKLGAFDYLSKPCELEALLGKIMEAYEHRLKHK
jgi:two-component system NtrC family sensor kinase